MSTSPFGDFRPLDLLGRALAWELAQRAALADFADSHRRQGSLAPGRPRVGPNPARDGSIAPTTPRTNAEHAWARAVALTDRETPAYQRVFQPGGWMDLGLEMAAGTPHPGAASRPMANNLATTLAWHNIVSALTAGRAPNIRDRAKVGVTAREIPLEARRPPGRRTGRPAPRGGFEPPGAGRTLPARPGQAKPPTKNPPPVVLDPQLTPELARTLLGAHLYDRLQSGTASSADKRKAASAVRSWLETVAPDVLEEPGVSAPRGVPSTDALRERDLPAEVEALAANWGNIKAQLATYTPQVNPRAVGAPTQARAQRYAKSGLPQPVVDATIDLETSGYRESLVRQIEDAIGKAQRAHTANSRYSSLTRAQDLIEVFQNAYSIPRDQLPGSAFTPGQGAGEGRHLMAGTQPSPFDHRAPIRFGPGSPSWVVERVKEAYPDISDAALGIIYKKVEAGGGLYPEGNVVEEAMGLLSRKVYPGSEPLFDEPGSARSRTKTPAKRHWTRLPTFPDGTAVTYTSGLKHSVLGHPVPIKLVTKPDGRKTIQIDPAEVKRTFKAKQWTTPRVPGVDPLPPDAFKTADEWADFLITHERQHQVLGSSPKSDPAAYAAHENAVNKAARDAKHYLPPALRSERDPLDPTGRAGGSRGVSPQRRRDPRWQAARPRSTDPQYYRQPTAPTWHGTPTHWGEPDNPPPADPDINRPDGTRLLVGSGVYTTQRYGVASSYRHGQGGPVYMFTDHGPQLDLDRPAPKFVVDAFANAAGESADILLADANSRHLTLLGSMHRAGIDPRKFGHSLTRRVLYSDADGSNPRVQFSPTGRTGPSTMALVHAWHQLRDTDPRDILEQVSPNGVTHLGGIYVGDKQHRVFVTYKPQQPVAWNFSGRRLNKILTASGVWDNPTSKWQPAKFKDLPAGAADYIAEAVRKNPEAFTDSHWISMGYSVAMFLGHYRPNMELPKELTNAIWYDMMRATGSTDLPKSRRASVWLEKIEKFNKQEQGRKDADDEYDDYYGY